MKAQRGIVLMLALLALGAMAMVACGLLFLAQAQSAAADAWAAHLRARLAAESAARAVLAGWETDAFIDLLPGGSADVAAAPVGEGVSTDASVEKLTGDAFLIRARARVDDMTGGASAEAGMLVRAIDPRPLRDASAAAVMTAGPVEFVDAAEFSGGPDADSCAAPPVPQGADSLVDLAAAAVTGNPARLSGLRADTSAPLPGISWQDAAALADRTVRGTAAPAPLSGPSGCELAAPGNWGDPTDPAAPCAGYFPLIYAAGDLEIGGGVGQGVLIVDGNLRVANAFDFTGVVVVRGSVDADGLRLSGALHAGSGAGGSVVRGGRIAFDFCAIRHVTSAAPALNRPFRTGSRVWIPLF